jgi:hypothetical protein
MLGMYTSLESNSVLFQKKSLSNEMFLPSVKYMTLMYRASSSLDTVNIQRNSIYYTHDYAIW